MATNDSDFAPLTEEDQQLFDSVRKRSSIHRRDLCSVSQYKDAIFARLQGTFPSVPSSFELKAVSLRRQLGCGTFYTYKVVRHAVRSIRILKLFFLQVGLPNGELADVTFHLGGKRATPLVGPPHFEITKSS